MQDNGDMGIYDVDNKKNIWAVGKNSVSSDTIFNDNITTKKAAHFIGYGTDTWFPYIDGRNYIRGPTQVDGQLLVNGVDILEQLKNTTRQLKGTLIFLSGTNNPVLPSLKWAD